MSFDMDIDYDGDNGDDASTAPSVASPTTATSTTRLDIARDALRVPMERLPGDLMRLHELLQRMENVLNKRVRDTADNITMHELMDSATIEHHNLRDRIELLQRTRAAYADAINTSEWHIKFGKLQRNIQQTTQRFEAVVKQVEVWYTQTELGLTDEEIARIDALTVPQRIQTTSQERRLPRHHRDVQSGEILSLEHDLETLAHTFESLAQLVDEQAPAVDAIDDNITQAIQETEMATKELSVAAKMSIGTLPVIGAVMGGLVGGPLGAMAGAHGAMLLGSVVAGGMLGYGAVKTFTNVKKDQIGGIEPQTDG